MISYHVFFTPKPGMEDDHVVELAHRFFKQLISEKKLRGYRILRVTNPANFQALPRFQAIADYESQQELDESFAFMHQPQKKEEGAHGELMKMVADFKVSFTTDV
ncbi:MAG: hypothetical protein NTV93_18750 [Verrucomicrobia bacterium]|nr:hypothetical protein [Verrucomicrobiota bacterium]